MAAAWVQLWMFFPPTKNYPTQNIMAVCGFDMRFTFVWLGWEGTAHDTRIFLAALSNPDLKFPKPPGEKYYLVDAGYPNMKGFLAPYKGKRYHLPHFRRGSQPRGTREIFNQAHSSLRSVIERTFGVWEARWGILEHIKFKSMDKQIVIVSATMALHNFIRTEDILNMEFQRFDTNDDYSLDEMNIGDLDNHIRMDDSEMGDICDRIATELASR
ncbi:hypothetical protein L1049_018102 [Liquidambar formosana]|uniref:DDE Tnp4 domain-containing protein n=1 Tax=Liquidambar formosana TaxID=63359 RepID=A0AAP0NI73_LIQFO